MELKDLLSGIDKEKFTGSLKAQAGEGPLFLDLVSVMLDAAKPVIAAAFTKAFKEASVKE